MKPRCSHAFSIAAVALLVCGHVAGQPSRPTVQERLGYPASARLLVIHADDLGMNHSTNRATFEALKRKWITSASILVPCPWFPEVVRFARENSDVDLGIHLALNSEWTDYRWPAVSPASAVPTLLDPDGYLPKLSEHVIARARPDEVEQELRAQIDKARAAGIRLSHLDSHMATLFDSPALFDVYRRLGAAYGLPVLMERLGARSDSTSAWSARAQEDSLIDRVIAIAPGVAFTDWKATYQKLLAETGPGVYELIVHLAHDDDEMKAATWDHADWGSGWRQADLDLVTDDGFRAFLKQQGFVLINWRDLARAKATP